jgi:hypothetical protein
MKNKIKLDEIYLWGSFEAEEKEIKKIGNDINPGYYTREVKQAIPLIKSITKNQNVKINVFDITRHILTESHNRDWFYTAGTRFDPTCMVRGKFHKIFREHNDMVYKGKKVGFVYGIDKPRLLRDDTNIYFSFLDLIMTTGTLPTNDIIGEYWENDEYFYWSPNLPQLVVKQAHLIYNYLKRINQLNTLTHLGTKASFHVSDYYQMIHPIIYPSWNTQTWQIKKPTSSVRDEVGKWFFDLAPAETQKKWTEGIQEMERQVGQRWFNNQTVHDGLIGSYSKFYAVGPL